MSARCGCRKDAAEIAALRAAGAAADRVAAQLQGGEIPLVGPHRGRRCRPTSADRLLAEGHDEVNFAIVAVGAERAPAPTTTPATASSSAGEVVLCDFGGTMDGYCSDITRCVSPSASRRPRWPRPTPCCSRRSRRRCAAAVVGTPCEEVDAVARRIIADAGYGDRFIHRTGHGIGMEEHEDPYIVAGNALPLAPGHAFSVEPGIYVAGRWGMRLEDIVVATADGPEAMNHVAPRARGRRLSRLGRREGGRVGRGA